MSAAGGPAATFESIGIGGGLHLQFGIAGNRIEHHGARC